MHGSAHVRICLFTAAPGSEDSPTGSTVTASSTAVSTRGLIRICPALRFVAQPRGDVSYSPDGCIVAAPFKASTCHFRERLAGILHAYVSWCWTGSPGISPTACPRFQMHGHSAFDRYPEFIPEEVNYTKIAIRVTVMNKVQFLLSSEPRESLKPRSLYVIFPVKKNMRVKRRRACDCRHHKKI